jgi:uncharacterized membrane protein
MAPRWAESGTGVAPCPRMQQPGRPAEIVTRNIQALLDVRVEAERRRTRSERVAAAITSVTGSMPFAYAHALVFGAWMAVNAGALPFVHPWDPPPFPLLAMLTAAEAIFLTTFVLVSQNRMQKVADQRAELNLHVDLLADHEVTRLLALTDAIAAKLGVVVPAGHEVEALKAVVEPERVLEEMERVERENAHE